MTEVGVQVCISEDVHGRAEGIVRLDGLAWKAILQTYPGAVFDRIADEVVEGCEEMLGKHHHRVTFGTIEE